MNEPEYKKLTVENGIGFLTFHRNELKFM